MSISQSTRRILNDSTLLACNGKWFQRLQNLFDSKPDPFNDKHVIGIFGTAGYSPVQNQIHINPEKWVHDNLESLAEKAQNITNENKFDPLCIEVDIYGVHFTDSIFGCEVFFQDDQWYNRYLPSEIGKLKRPDLEKCEAWHTAKRIAKEFVKQDVKLPLFGLPTIASALIAAVNLYGDEILTSLLADPDAARHDLEIINDTLCEIHEWFRKTIPANQLQCVLAFERTQPPGYGQICGCTTQLISGDMYNDIFAPLDEKLLGVYPCGGMIHLCGAHEQLIPTLRNMKSLKSVQINDRASLDIEKYYQGLRPDQIIYFMPCEEMTVEQAIEITGGNRLVIQKPLNIYSK